MSEIPSAVLESLESIAKSLENTPSYQRSMIEELTIIATAMGYKEVNMKNLIETIDENTDLFGESIEERKKTERENKRSDEDYEIGHKDLGGKLGSFIGATSLATKGVYSSAKALANTDGSLKSLTDALSNLPVIGGIFSALGFLAGIVDETVASYGTAAKSGIQFSDGIFGLMRTSGELGLGLKETAEMFAKYSTVVQRVGAPAFSSFIKEVRTNSDKLYALGFTYDDIIEKSAEFLETQRNLTGLRVLNEQEQKILFDQAVDEFYKAAQITGVGVTELLEEFNKMSKDANTRLIMKQLPATGQRTLAMIQSQSPEMAATLMEALQKGGIQRVQNYSELLASGVAEEYEKILRIIQSGDSNSMENVRDSMKSAAANIEQNALVFLQRGQDNIAAHAALFAKIANDFSTADIKSTSEAAAVDESTKAVMELQPAIRNAIADVRQKVLEGAISMLGPGTDLNKMLTSVISGLGDFLKDPKTMEGLKFLLGGLSWIGTKIKDAVVGILGLFGLDTPINTALVLGVGSMIGTLFGGTIITTLARVIFGGVFRLAGGLMTKGVKSKFGLIAAVAGTALTYGAYELSQYFSEDEAKELEGLKTGEETPAPPPDATPTNPEQFVEQVRRVHGETTPVATIQNNDENLKTTEQVEGKLTPPAFDIGMLKAMREGNNAELIKIITQILGDQQAITKMSLIELISLMEAFESNIDSMNMSKEEADAYMKRLMDEYGKKLKASSSTAPATQAPSSSPAPSETPIPSPSNMDMASVSPPAQPVQSSRFETRSPDFAQDISKGKAISEIDEANMNAEEERIELALLDEMRKSTELTQMLLSLQTKSADATREAFQRNTSVVTGVT